MRKEILFSLSIIVLAALSCKKSVDSAQDAISSELSSDVTAAGGSTPADNYATCKLRGILYWDLDINGAPRKMEGVFTYYSNGNVFSLVFKVGGFSYYSLPRYNFFNDSKGRMKEWRLAYQDGADVRIIHRFGYNHKNLIVTDTIISKTYSVDDIKVSTLTYDSQGRIIKENIKHIQTTEDTELEEPKEYTYAYDHRGNLIVPGWPSSQYDNKVSLYRSHPAFMFLFRNYSRNNPSTQATYNSRGLPLKWKSANDDFFSTKDIDKVAYDCK